MAATPAGKGSSSSEYIPTFSEYKTEVSSEPRMKGLPRGAFTIGNPRYGQDYRLLEEYNERFGITKKEPAKMIGHDVGSAGKGGPQRRTAATPGSALFSPSPAPPSASGAKSRGPLSSMRGRRMAFGSPAPGSPPATGRRALFASPAAAPAPPRTPEGQGIRSRLPIPAELLRDTGAKYPGIRDAPDAKNFERNRLREIQAAALAEAAEKSTTYGTFKIRGGTRRRRNHRKSKKHAATHKHKSTNKSTSTSRRRRSHTRVSRRRARGAK